MDGLTDTPRPPDNVPTMCDESYVSSEPEPEPEKEWERRLRFVQNILSGKLTVALHQEFLIRNNHTDLQILRNTKVRVVC